ncbi:MAG: hypothetical protein HFE76_17195 [Firmicutes bacterium]|nr:hypothetical protein [Bacillota bacterium]
MLEQKDLEMIAEIMRQVAREEIKPLETMIENDVVHNIKIIAEGHADLSRKLSDAIETERERELLKVRVNLLEADVKMLKAKLNA